MGLLEHHLQGLDDEGCILTLGSFVHAVKLGDNMKKLPHMSADSVSNYLVSAHQYLELLLGRKILILDKNHGGKCDPYHPFLAQQLSDWPRWHKPSDRYKPYTVDKFVALCQWLLRSPTTTSAFFGKIHSFCS